MLENPACLVLLISCFSGPISLFNLSFGLQNDVAEVYFHQYFKHRSLEDRPGKLFTCLMLPEHGICSLINGVTFPVTCSWLLINTEPST